MHSWGIKQLKIKTSGDDSDRSGSMASFGGQRWLRLKQHMEDFKAASESHFLAWVKVTKGLTSH